MARQPFLKFRRLAPIWVSAVILVPGEVLAETENNYADPNAANLPIAAAATLPIDRIKESQHLMLLVSVNGQPGAVVPVQRRANEFWVSRGDLAALGIKPPSSPVQLIELSTLEGAITQFDEAQQALTLTVPTQMLDAEVSYLNQGEDLALEASPSTGFLLNYDASLNYFNGQPQLGLFSGLRAFGPAGTFETTALAGWQNGSFDAVRFDTSFTRSFPGQRQQLRIGDVITSGTNWSRLTRLGGIGFGTDFTLQPNFVTTPIQSSFGSAALPSRLELFVNGAQRFSAEVQPGPFVVDLGPNRFEGPGTAQVVLTDALGRASVQNLNFYNSPRLLRAGLDEWSVEAGFVREDYGLRSFAYDDALAGNVTWRRGLSDRFTIEAHAEARSDLFLAGAGQTMSLDQFGVVASSISRSQSAAGSGERMTLSYDWRNGFFNFSGELTRSWGNFVDLGANSDFALTPPDSEFFQAGFSDVGFGALTANYGRFAYASGLEVRYAGLAWTKQIAQRMALRLSYRHGFDDNVGSGVFLSLDVTLPNQTFSSLGLGRSEGQNLINVQAQRTASPEGGFGWQAALQKQPGGTNLLGRVQALGDAGELSGTLARSFGQLRANASLRGSLVYMGGGLFAARTIDESFALVSTNGYGDVPISLNNRIVGRTNGAGQLLVTGLQSWQANQIGIDTTDLPAWVRVEAAKGLAIPADRTGTRVSFNLNRLRAVSLQLANRDGDVLPAGWRAIMGGAQGAEFLIGFDGMLYIEEPLAGALIRVETADGSCLWRLPSSLKQDGISTLGRQVCEPEAAPVLLTYAKLAMNDDLLTFENRTCRRPRPFISSNRENASPPMICKEEI